MPGAWLLTFSGGFFFGWIIGSFLTVIGATIGASILFILSKSILGKYLNQKIKNKINKFIKVFPTVIMSNIIFFI